MAKYFWNKQGIGDTANFKGPKLLLDYLHLLKQSDERSMEDYANSFVSLACRQQTFGPILYWLDNILYDSASPHYDESIYLRLMTIVLTSDADSVMKLITAKRVKMMKKIIMRERMKVLDITPDADFEEWERHHYPHSICHFYSPKISCSLAPSAGPRRSRATTFHSGSTSRLAGMELMP